ncbi:carboxypeptidase-like regulatory domain-containing protein [Chitinophagaceae bacterium 26-R-25]|nr:carboxypeptidase-like regulatory domain-containing protein [Chitinophagaceae bacterium 26-R-25]
MHMQRLLLSVLTIFFVQFAFAQSDFYVKGRVTDTTGAPLAKASVFCQNTTLGTITDNDGNFQLKLPKGGYDLIVTFTGYETFQTQVNNNNSANPLSVTLQPKGKQLEDVVFTSSSELADGLEKYGSFFNANFIGSTEDANKCQIENPQALKFFFSKKKNRLKVTEREDLVIVNKALGYKIHYKLDSLTYEYSNKTCTYTGFPFFETLEGTPEEQKVWKANRLKAYNGSRMHFMRAWYNHNLEKEGFEIEKVTSLNPFAVETISNPYDSSIYGIDSNEVAINYDGRLRIKYHNEMPEKAYIEFYKLPTQLRAQLTVIEINEGFNIMSNGYFYDQTDVTNNGYWSWEKLAESLPYDYVPEE